MARCLTRGTVASFVKAYYLSFSYIMNKDLGRFLALQILCSFSFFPFFIYCKTAVFTHTHPYRFQSTMDLTGNDSATASYDFENPINLAEDEGEDDWW